MFTLKNLLSSINIVKHKTIQFIVLASFYLFYSLNLFADTPYRYIVYFKDKPQQADPSVLFTKAALERRAKFNIPFDERDKPVNPSYIEQLKESDVKVIYQSNWLNAVLVESAIADPVQLKNLPFIANIQMAGGGNVKHLSKGKFTGTQSLNESEACEDVLDYEDNYTSSYSQYHLLKGEYLHELGYNGEGMTIAVCDNSFYNVNANPAFSHIFSENRLFGTYDYVHGDSAVYDEYTGSGSNPQSHGSNCLSFIGGLKTDQYIGTSTKSNFYLFHTENNASERLQEEFNLALALERCSQVGVDIVSVSLGYFSFDVPSENHDTSDMRSNNTPGAIAVNAATSKGMLVFVAAGNSSDGIYITTPSDADSAVCVAAVDINGNVASFSSQGLPGDPRIKPNIAAMGVSAALLNTSGNVNYGSGTSYATPSVAGMAACLWQAFPTKSNWEIKTAIEQSASQYASPDKRIGYGIPNFEKAYNILSPSGLSFDFINDAIKVYPNPFNGQFIIKVDHTVSNAQLSIMNMIGQVLWQEDLGPSRGFEDHIVEASVSDGWAKGIYLVQLSDETGIYLKKIIKD